MLVHIEWSCMGHGFVQRIWEFFLFHWEWETHFPWKGGNLQDVGSLSERAVWKSISSAFGAKHVKVIRTEKQ
jgi:hypothetical protein